MVILADVATNRVMPAEATPLTEVAVRVGMNALVTVAPVIEADP